MPVFIREDTNGFSCMEVGDVSKILSALFTANMGSYSLVVNSAMNLAIVSDTDGGVRYHGYIDLAANKLELQKGPPVYVEKEIDKPMISLADLLSAIQPWTGGSNKNLSHYRLFPTTEGNLSVSTHYVSGPQGPCSYYIGWIDFAEGRMIQFNKEFPGADANSYMKGGSFEIPEGTGHDRNIPGATVEVKVQGT